MTKTLSIFIYSSLLLCLSCSTNKKEYVAKVKVLKLTHDHIYDQDMVSDVIFDSEELDVDSLKIKSHQLFLKGINEFKNNKNPEKAVILFKESILTFPDAKTYYELGNAKLEIGAKAGDVVLEEANKAYDVAEFLNFKPLSMIYYKQACVYNNRREKDERSVTNILIRAFGNGFSDTTMLKNEVYLKSFLHADVYKNLMTQ